MTTTILDRRPVTPHEAEPEPAGEQGRLATVTVLRQTPRPSRRRSVAAPTRSIPRAPAPYPGPRQQPAVTRPKPVRLTARGQSALVVAVLAVTLLAVVTVVAGALARAGAAQLDPATTRTVVVQPGDTLWDIAAVAAPSADPRSTINAIEDLNGLDAANGVRPGLRLVVPAG